MVMPLVAEVVMPELPRVSVPVPPMAMVEPGLLRTLMPEKVVDVVMVCDAKLAPTVLSKVAI